MMNVNDEVRKAFNACALNYQRAAVAQREIGERLFERLSYLTMKPRTVLDLGCGSGFFTQRLKACYPDAHIVGLDVALNMLSVAATQGGTVMPASWVNADMDALPFQANSFDLIFSNQVIHWAPSLAKVMKALYRVLAPEGCLMFSTLGPDTFLELRHAFRAADHHAHTNEFVDLHEVGDALLSNRFVDPVVDMERLTLHYHTLSALLRALKAQGVRHVNPKRCAGLMGRQAWQRFEASMQTLRTETGQVPLTYEVVYGHAWKGGLDMTEVDTEFTVSLDAMKALLKETKK